MCTRVCMCKSQRITCQESSLSFYHAGSGKSSCQAWCWVPVLSIQLPRFTLEEQRDKGRPWREDRPFSEQCWIQETARPQSVWSRLANQNPYILDKNSLKTDFRLKCKNVTTKFQEKHGRKSLRSRIRFFFRSDTRNWFINGNFETLDLINIKNFCSGIARLCKSAELLTTLVLWRIYLDFL